MLRNPFFDYTVTMSDGATPLASFAILSDAVEFMRFSIERWGLGHYRLYAWERLDYVPEDLILRGFMPVLDWVRAETEASHE